MRKTSVKLTLIASLFLISPCAGAQTCGGWYGPIIQSFLPKPSANPGAIGDQLKQLAVLPPDQYFAAAAQHEEKADAEYISNAIDDPQTLVQLKSALVALVARANAVQELTLRQYLA